MVIVNRRRVVIGTESTYFYPSENGGRLCELAMIELIDNVPTGKHYHSYFNPLCTLPSEICKLIELSNNFLSKCPLFVNEVSDILKFIEGADLIFYGACFDVRFLDWEISQAYSEHGEYEPLSYKHMIIDTLSIIRMLMPSEKGEDILEMFHEKVDIFDMKTSAILDANKTLCFYLGIDKLVNG